MSALSQDGLGTNAKAGITVGVMISAARLVDLLVLAYGFRCKTDYFQLFEHRQVLLTTQVLIQSFDILRGNIELLSGLTLYGLTIRLSDYRQ
jgi:hypothetical protein